MPSDSYIVKKLFNQYSSFSLHFPLLSWRCYCGLSVTWVSATLSTPINTCMLLKEPREKVIFLTPSLTEKWGFSHRISLFWNGKGIIKVYTYLEKEFAPSNTSFKLLFMVFYGMSSNNLHLAIPMGIKHFLNVPTGTLWLVILATILACEYTLWEKKPNLLNTVCWLIIISSTGNIFIKVICFIHISHVLRCNINNLILFLDTIWCYDLLLLLWAYKWVFELEAHLLK